MAAFTYVTQNLKGGPFLTGRVTGTNQLEARERLLERKIPVLALHDAVPKVLPLSRKKIKVADKVSFAERFEAALYLKMPIDRALLSAIGKRRLAEERSGATLARRRKTSKTASRKNLEAVIQNITRRVVDGSKFFLAAELYPNLFDRVAVGLIEAGELSGNLDANVRSWRESLQRVDKLQHEFKMMSVYPAFLSVLALGVIGILTNLVIPQFKGIFAQLHRELPLPTRLVISFSDLCTAYPWLIFAAVLLLICCLVGSPAFVRRTPQLHGIVFKMPFLGALQRLVMQTNFIRTFARLKSAGIKLDEALVLCQNVGWNYHYRGAIGRAINLVRAGEQLGPALEPEADIMGQDLLEYLSFTEEEGAPEDSLFRLANLMDRQLDARLAIAKVVFQQVLTLALGGIVACIVLATFMPLSSLNSAL
jgi:general secretion pathway protein F